MYRQAGSNRAVLAQLGNKTVEVVNLLRVIRREKAEGSIKRVRKPKERKVKMVITTGMGRRAKRAKKASSQDGPQQQLPGPKGWFSRVPAMHVVF